MPSIVPQRSARPASAYADVLPPWLNYLVAAFPNAKLAAATLAVLEQAFQDIDPAAMMAAAQSYVRTAEWFPTVAALRPHAERAAETADRHTIPYHVHWRRVLRARPTCPTCGEHIPPGYTSDDCPFCADLARMTVAEEGR